MRYDDKLSCDVIREGTRRGRRRLQLRKLGRGGREGQGRSNRIRSDQPLQEARRRWVSDEGLE